MSFLVERRTLVPNNLFFSGNTPESAALLFQYARRAHIYRGPNVLLVLVLLFVISLKII